MMTYVTEPGIQFLDGTSESTRLTENDESQYTERRECCYRRLLNFSKSRVGFFLPILLMMLSAEQVQELFEREVDKSQLLTWIKRCCGGSYRCSPCRRC